MKQKAVIFDLDGVLISTDEFHYLAWKEIADQEGIPFSREDNNALRGVSRMDSLNLILKKSNKVYSDKEKEALATKKNTIYKRYLITLTKESIDTSIVDILDIIRGKGYLIGLGSSSKNTKLILEEVGLSTYFDAVIDGNDIKNSKPNPEVFLKVAKKLGANPTTTYVIEDASSGIEAASSGGFIPIAIGPATSNKKAIFTIAKISDLLNILK